MSALALALSLASAAPVVPDSEALFSRPEPHLVEGNAKLRAGEPDAALEAFRKANAKSSDERAMVEYDVGSALLLKAENDAAAAPKAEGGEQKIDVADARASFERAYGLAAHPALKSESALANGNAAALGGDVDAAIAQYRKALIADPSNERAKKNLRRALDAKRAQPPPPPNEQPQDGEEPPDDHPDAGPPPEPSDGGSQPKDQQGEQKPEPDEKDGEQKPQPQPGDEDDQQEQKPDPKKQKQQDARRLLDALRSREKPLTPMEMRGVTGQKPKNGKDW